MCETFLYIISNYVIILKIIVLLYMMRRARRYYDVIWRQRRKDFLKDNF